MALTLCRSGRGSVHRGDPRRPRRSAHDDDHDDAVDGDRKPTDCRHTELRRHRRIRVIDSRRSSAPTGRHAHGGETAASYAYVSEIAPPRHRGLWSSAVFLSVSVGTLCATALGAGISAALPAADADSWGWRIPFFLGAGLAVYSRCSSAAE
ncbi:MFS transporter [Rhodococcus qingshengii]